MPKKFLALLLAAFLAFSCIGLSACGSSKSKSMSTKAANDAKYAKQLHDAIPDAYGK